MMELTIPAENEMTEITVEPAENVGGGVTKIVRLRKKEKRYSKSGGQNADYYAKLNRKLVADQKEGTSTIVPASVEQLLQLSGKFGEKNVFMTDILQQLLKSGKVLFDTNRNIFTLPNGQPLDKLAKLSQPAVEPEQVILRQAAVEPQILPRLIPEQVPINLNVLPPRQPPQAAEEAIIPRVISNGPNVYLTPPPSGRGRGGRNEIRQSRRLIDRNELRSAVEERGSAVRNIANQLE